MKVLNCVYCEKPLEGRSDKIYCDVHCKSSHQYQKTKEGKAGFYSQVDRHLKLNRKLLKIYNKAGKATIRETILLAEGFDPNYFTHIWRNKKGDVYRFVYEFGFLKKEEAHATKFILVKWQEYMARSN